MKKLLPVFFVVIIFSLRAQTQQCSTPPNTATITPFSQTVCATSPGTLSVFVSPPMIGYGYQWQRSTTSAAGPYLSIPNATNVTLGTGSVVGTSWYICVVTCTILPASLKESDSARVHVSDCTGLAEAQADAFNVYPVPATDVLVVNAELPTMLTVTGADGRVYGCRAERLGNKAIVDISALAPGIYVLREATANGRRRLFVVER